MELQLIQNKIYKIRGQQVMLDRDLATIYGIETRTLKQAVRRNRERFPADFMFELTQNEANALINIGISQSVIPSNYNIGATKPFAFTEQGVAMLASVLKSKQAVMMNIEIIRAFVAIRQMVLENKLQTLEISELKHRMAEIERSLEGNLEAMNDLSEDVRHEIDTIYTAIGELAIRQKQIEEQPKTERPKVGFKI